MTIRELTERRETLRKELRDTQHELIDALATLVHRLPENAKVDLVHYALSRIFDTGLDIRTLFGPGGVEAARKKLEEMTK